MTSIVSESRTGGIALGTILARYWFLPVVLAVALGVVGTVIGLSRSPEYTASSALSVGTTDVNNSSALGGFAASAPALASAYARAIDAQDVIVPAGRQLGLPPGVVRAQVTASQVPDTPVIRVDAVSVNKQRAIGLANASSSALRDYAGNLTRSTDAGKDILKRYRSAQIQVVQVIRQRDASAKSGGDVRAAEGDIAAARLQRDSLARAYRESQIGQGASNPLAVLSQASSATSDRSGRAQLYGFSGLVAGLVIGAAMALAVGRRQLGR